MHTFSQMVPESGRAMFEIFQWWLDMARATEVPAHRIACPVFSAAGELDTLNPPETVKRIAARYRAQDDLSGLSENEPLADRRAGLGRHRGGCARLAQIIRQRMIGAALPYSGRHGRLVMPAIHFSACALDPTESTVRADRWMAATTGRP